MYTFNTPHILTLFSNWSALCTSLMKPVRHFECTMPKLSGTFSALCTSLLKPMSALCAHFWNLSGTLVALCTSLLKPVQHFDCIMHLTFRKSKVNAGQDSKVRCILHSKCRTGFKHYAPPF